MSHCHHGGRCPMRPYCIAAAALGLMLLAGAYLLGCPESPLAKRPMDMAKYATLADLASLGREGLGHFGRFEAEVRGEIDAVKAESHALRKALAGELRKEANSAVAAESVKRGQQITAERTQRRKDIEALMDRTANTFGVVGRDLGTVEAKLAKLERLEQRLLAVEKLWLAHRCPEPCKCRHQSYPSGPIGPPVLPAPAKVLPPGCPPNMYTIPYPQAYGLPRCR